jgi:hypothetical protein
MGAATSQSARWRAAYSLVATGALAGLAYFIFFYNAAPAGRARELILYVGNYPSPTEKFALHVEIDPQNNVGYRVIDRESGQQAFGGNIGDADKARWCLCWDGADNLWVCGELEGVVYVRVPGSDYRCYSLREKDYSKSMPPKFREFYKAGAGE